MDQIPGRALVEINKRIGARLLARVGQRVILKFPRAIPVVGGVVVARSTPWCAAWSRVPQARCRDTSSTSRDSPAFRVALESVFGPLSTQALASQIFGLYTGFVYFTPMIGGLVADRWIGQRNAVVIGALVMTAGHLSMAFDRSFLLALVLLVLGSGFLKGNISAQVGALYPVDDEARRTRGFAIFSTGINFGAVVGPLLCGLLAQLYGWHVGFGAAAVFMIGGLATYLYGYRYLPARVERRARVGTEGSLTAADWRVMARADGSHDHHHFQSIAYYQLANVLPVWMQDHVSMSAGGFSLPIPWFQSIDPLFSILGVPLLFWLWTRQARRQREPDDLGKIGQGAWLCMVANVVLVLAILAAGSRQVHWFWVFLYCAIQGIGFLYYWPTLLALVSRKAPAQVNATMMGLAFMSVFVGNILIGWIGGFYEKMTPLGFWLLHVGIAACGGVLILLFGRSLARALNAAVEQPLRPSAMTHEVER